MRMMRLHRAEKDVGVDQKSHLQTADAVDRGAADCFVGKQRSGSGVAMYPGFELLKPLFGIQFRPRTALKPKPLTDRLDAHIHHVVCVRDQTCLNRQPDRFLLFRVEPNRHIAPRLLLSQFSRHTAMPETTSPRRALVACPALRRRRKTAMCRSAPSSRPVRSLPQSREERGPWLSAWLLPRGLRTPSRRAVPRRPLSSGRRSPGVTVW